MSDTALDACARLRLWSFAPSVDSGLVRTRLTLALLVALAAAPATPARASVIAGMHPTCPASFQGMPGKQQVSEANAERGRIQCEYSTSTYGLSKTPFSFRLNGSWLGPASDAWRTSSMGCGRHSQLNWFVSQTHLATVILTEAFSHSGPDHSEREQFARELLAQIEQGYAISCNGPPRLPKFKWRVAVNKTAPDVNGLAGYRRTQAKGNGTFTTDAGGNRTTGVSGSIALIHRLRKGSRTVVLKLVKPLGSTVIGKRKSIYAEAVVTLSELRGCSRGDRVRVELSDRSSVGERDELNISRCDRADEFSFRDGYLRGQTVDVQVKSV